MSNPCPSYSPADLDIVWCAFPYDGHGNSIAPGEKARPCLVIGRESNVLLNDEFIYVAYGTTQAGKRAKYGVLIDDALSMGDGGLFKPTLFRLNKVALLPFNAHYFPSVPAINGNPPKAICRMGVMNESCRRRMVQSFRNMANDELDLDEVLFDAKRRIGSHLKNS